MFSMITCLTKIHAFFLKKTCMLLLLRLLIQRPHQTSRHLELLVTIQADIPLDNGVAFWCSFAVTCKENWFLKKQYMDKALNQLLKLIHQKALSLDQVPSPNCETPYPPSKRQRPSSPNRD